MNRVQAYSDDELAGIIEYSNNLIHQIDNKIIQAWIMGGLLIAKRELYRRECVKAKMA